MFCIFNKGAWGSSDHQQGGIWAARSMLAFTFFDLDFLILRKVEKLRNNIFLKFGGCLE